MVNQQIQSDDTLSLVLGAIASPLRREILSRLGAGPVRAGDLWVGTGVSKPAISKNLAVLEEAGLITRTRDGRTQWIALNGLGLVPALDWLERCVRPDSKADHRPHEETDR